MKSSGLQNHFDKVLISDFDGTMTRFDFYQLAVERLLPPDAPDYWSQYRTGTITHFEALRSYFAQIRVSEIEVLDIVRKMDLDPRLSSSIQSLNSAGWTVIVTSAGCDWYIRHLLAAAAVDLRILSNPGRFESGKGLIMEKNLDSPYFSETLGVDKAGVVRDYVNRGFQVAFAGDGFPDEEPSKLVTSDLRFARGNLAEVLRSKDLTFHPFDRWSDIAQVLLQRGI